MTAHLFAWGETEEVTAAPGAPPLAAAYLDAPLARAGDRRPRLGGRAPLVGRQAELRVLDNALRAAVAGRGRVVLLTGEPGLGKTRLVQESRGRFIGWVGAGTGRRPLWLEGRAASYASATPYSLFRHLIASWVGIALDQPPAQIRAALADALRNLMGNTNLLAPLSHLMGLPPAEPGAAGPRDRTGNGGRVGAEQQRRQAFERGPRPRGALHRHGADRARSRGPALGGPDLAAAGRRTRGAGGQPPAAAARDEQAGRRPGGRRADRADRASRAAGARAGDPAAPARRGGRGDARPLPDRAGRRTRGAHRRACQRRGQPAVPRGAAGRDAGDRSARQAARHLVAARLGRAASSAGARTAGAVSPRPAQPGSGRRDPRGRRARRRVHHELARPDARHDASRARRRPGRTVRERPGAPRAARSPELGLPLQARADPGGDLPRAAADRAP